MALQKITKDGYGQLELNLVAFPRDGRIVAQYKAGTTFTAEGVTGDDRYLENGMLLKVDGANRCVDKAEPAEGDIYALNYSTEHMYDERQYALKTFRLNSVNDFYPRLGYLAAGDKFTTNTLCYDDEAENGFKSEEEVMTALAKFATAPVYGKACANGYIELVKKVPVYGPALRVIEVYTMPDGQFGVKLEAIRG